MRFDIITIFPRMFENFLGESLIKRALEWKLIDIRVHDLRRWTTDKHKTVDDRPYGGGPGMILKIEPIAKAVKAIVNARRRKARQVRVIMMDPAGEQFTQAVAKRLSEYKQVVLLCGRYEGFDARVRLLADERISVGPYVLSGGEVPAMVVTETVSRYVPEVIGHQDALKEETHNQEGYQEYPQYTRPEFFQLGRKKLAVPKVLLSGDHKKIRRWRTERGE